MLLQPGALKELGESQHQSAAPARRARGQDGVVAAAGDRRAVRLHPRGRGQGARRPRTGSYFFISIARIKITAQSPQA